MRRMSDSGREHTFGGMTMDFTRQREKMVDGQLRTTDVTSPAVLAAMLKVPREAFVPSARRAFAYIDEDILVLEGAGRRGRYLMEPSPFARLVQLSSVGKEDVVLDIGCASGYSTAVLSCLAGSVIALECESGLANEASERLTRLGYDNTVVVEGPLEAGFASEAPYDVIFLNGAVEQVPETLFGQLRDGGRLVGVVGSGNTGVATLWTRSGGAISSRRAFNAAVRPLPGFEREKVFEF
jgi:protein-L-isoaspartate(D-aspartate) O-methyltransferase